jgi:ParB family chromosome partitioning protein
VDSIKTNGVMLPVIVRPAVDGGYEILSGHNRVKAAEAAGLSEVPCIVRDGLTEEDALLIVTETNLLQRSFADLSHSERALSLSAHYGAIKKQGRRTDLINDIENMLKPLNTAVPETCTPVGYKLKSVEKLGEKYGLGRESVARYLRINKLIDSFKLRVDENEIAIRAGVVLSYLPDKQQEIVDNVLNSGNYKLDLKKAEALKAAYEKKQLTHDSAEEILKGQQKHKATYPSGFKLQQKILSKYFKPEQKRADIEGTIVKALDYYFIHNKTETAGGTGPGIQETESSPTS